MKLFFRRPLALFCALFTAALICGCFLLREHCRAVWICTGSIGVILLVCVLLLPKRLKATVLYLSLCLIFVASALANCDLRLLTPQNILSQYTKTEASVTLSVLQVRYQYSYATSYLVEVERIGQDRGQSKAILTYEYDPDLSVGDWIFGTAYIDGIEGYATHTGTYLADGITLSLTPTKEGLFFIKNRSDSGIVTWVRELNQALSASLTVGIGGEEGALVSSLLLGNRELLEGQVLRDFRRAGIVHMLAISGMHLSLMVLLTEFLLRKFYIPKAVRCVLVLCVALFYLALTGFSLSTVRAFIMTAFVYLAYLFRGDNDPMTSLFFALFMILVILPRSIYDAGMWLSFSATLGILISIELLRPVSKWLYEHIQSKRLCQCLNAALCALCVSLAASFSVFLPAWLFFDEISLLSVPATLLLSPLVTGILYLSPFYLLFSSVSPLASFLSLIIRLLCKLLLGGASLFAKLPNLTISLHFPFEGVLIPLASVLLAVLLLLRLRKKFFVPLVALCTALAFFICLGAQLQQGKDTLKTSYLRKGDSEMLLLINSESTVICDLSNGMYSSAYNAYLHSKEQFSTEIEAYVLTHYHNQQAATLRRLSEQTLVRRLFLPFPKTETEYYIMLSLLELCEQCGISATVYDRGKPLPIEGDFTLFISEEIYLKRSSHPTCYVAVVAHEELFLYLGESVHESALLQNELNSLVGKAETVVLGIHGPVTKTVFPYSFENVSTLILSDESLLSYLAPATIPSGEWIVGSETVTVTTKK